MNEVPPQVAAGSPEALDNALPQLLPDQRQMLLLDLPTHIISDILNTFLNNVGHYENANFTSSSIPHVISKSQIPSLRLVCSMFNNLVLARATKMVFHARDDRHKPVSIDRFSSLPMGLLQSMPNLQILDLGRWGTWPLSLAGLPTTITTLKLRFSRSAPRGEKTDPPLDLLPLSDCIGLRVLDISSTRKQVKDLSPLAACKHLENLNIHECSALTSLSPLAHCTKLRSVNLGGTAITDLSPLSACKELEIIDCSGSRVSDLSPLAHCTNLHSVYLHETFITDLSPLSACKKLERVDCLRSRVNDITSLTACPRLRDIACNKDVTGLLMKSLVYYHPDFPKVNIDAYGGHDDLFDF
eukprot:gene27077-biopygen822